MKFIQNTKKFFYYYWFANFSRPIRLKMQYFFSCFIYVGYKLHIFVMDESYAIYQKYIVYGLKSRLEKKLMGYIDN